MFMSILHQIYQKPFVAAIYDAFALPLLLPMILPLITKMLVPHWNLVT